MQSRKSYCKNRNRVESCILLLMQNDGRRKNYKIHNAELLAIVKSFCHWCHYLEQPYHTLKVLIDHSNLHSFMNTNKLTRKQVQLALDLSAFHFWLVHRKDTINPPDSSSRLPDYQRDAEFEDSMADNTFTLQKMLLVYQLLNLYYQRRRKLDKFYLMVLLIYNLQIKNDKHVKLFPIKAYIRTYLNSRLTLYQNSCELTS